MWSFPASSSKPTASQTARVLHLTVLLQILSGILLVVLVAMFPASRPAAANEVELRAAEHPGFGRIVFESTDFLRINNTRLGDAHWQFTFNQPLKIDSGLLTKLLPSYIQTSSIAADQLSLNLRLRDDFSLERSSYGTAQIFDFLLPRQPTATPPKRTTAAAVPTSSEARDPRQPQISSIDDNFVPYNLDSFANSLRITFSQLQQPPAIQMTASGLSLAFRHPIRGNPQLDAASRKYLASMQLSNNRRTIAIEFQPGITFKPLQYLDSYIIDIYGADPGGAVRAVTDTSANQAIDVINNPIPEQKTALDDLNLVKVRIGEHPDFVRLVFDWPRQVNYNIDHRNDRVSITFNQQVQFELPTIPASSGSLIGPLTQQQIQTSSRVSFDLDSAIPVKHNRIGTRVILDIVISERNPVAELIDRLSGETIFDPEIPVKSDQTVAEEIIQQRGRSPELDRDALTALYFDWIDSVGAALFQYGDKIWVVFDAANTFDLEKIRQQTADFFTDIIQLPSNTATVLRFSPKRQFYPSINQIGFTWQVRFDEQPIVNPIHLNPETLTGEDGFEVHIPTGQTNKVITIIDPDSKETIIVGTIANAGFGIRKAHAYPGFQLPVTQQGVMVLPLDEVITMRSEYRRFIISRPGGLNVSAVTDSAGNVFEPQTPLRQSLLDLRRWLSEDATSYGVPYTLTKITSRYISATDELRRDYAWYLLSKGYIPEAHGAAKHFEKQLAQLEKDKVPPLSAMIMAAIAVLAQDSDMEQFWLEHPRIRNHPETRLWRATAAAKRGDWNTAVENFYNTDFLLESYTDQVFAEIAILKLEALIAAGSREDTDIWLYVLENRSDSFSASQLRWIEYLRATVLANNQQVLSAKRLWNQLGSGQDKAAYYSQYQLLADRINNQIITPEDAILELERLAIQWRGDDLELFIIDQIATNYSKINNLFAALTNYRRALSYFPDHPYSIDLRYNMIKLFRNQFIQVDSALTPTELFNLYKNFQELVPTGPEGDRLTELLADRLYNNDYLTEASELLQREFNFRLEGDEKRRVGIKLAMIYFELGDSSAAIDLLDQTDVTNLPANDLRRQDVLLLKSYFLAGEQQFRSASDLLAGVVSLEADLLRRDIALTQKDWQTLILALERLTGPPPEREDTIMATALQRHLLNWAIALFNLRDQPGLQQLAAAYQPFLPDNSVKKLFDSITTNPEELISSDVLAALRDLEQLAPSTVFVDLLQNRYFSTIS